MFALLEASFEVRVLLPLEKILVQRLRQPMDMFAMKFWRKTALFITP